MTAKMTPAQAAWLTKLRDSDISLPRPPKSSVGFNCMVRRWTEWAPYSDWREVITPLGLAALAEYEARK